MRWISTLVLSSLVLAACARDDGMGEGAATVKERPANVRVLEVGRSDLDEWLTVSGRLAAVRATDVSTEEAGVVEEILADRGTEVEKGEVLVLLDRRLLDAQWKAAEAAAVLRRYNEERTRTLYDEESVSKQEMLRVHTESEQARQNAEIARLHYERAAIASPFDGVVVDRKVEVGQFVVPGQVVARVVDSSELELEAYVTEAEVARLRVGAPARLEVTGISDPVWARLRWVSVEASPVTGKFALEIRVSNPEGSLRAGVLAAARILVARHEQVLAIPRDAITRGSDGPRVLVVEGSRAVARPVTLGADQGAMVVVTSGLTEGESLIVRGQRDVSDGSLVAVTEFAQRRDGSAEGDPPEVREESRMELPLDFDLGVSGSSAETETR